MRSYFAEVQNLKEDGAYVITDKGIENYGERWGFGYLVILRDLTNTDLHDWTLFYVSGIDEEVPGELVEYKLVRHIAAIQDAKKLSADFDQTWMYDLRDEKWVSV